MESPIIKLMTLRVVMDTCFSFIRAMKKHKINSGFVIEGTIQKTYKPASLAFLLLFDQIVHLNLIYFIAEAARAYLLVNSVGVAEFFGLLYVLYAMISILKI